LVLVLSDFLDPGGHGPGIVDEQVARTADESLLRGLSLLRTAGHDVALVQILHRDELVFPWDRQRVIELEDPRGRRPTIEGPESLLREVSRARTHLRWLSEVAARRVALAHAATRIGRRGAELPGRPPESSTRSSTWRSPVICWPRWPARPARARAAVDRPPARARATGEDPLWCASGKAARVESPSVELRDRPPLLIRLLLLALFVLVLRVRRRQRGRCAVLAERTTRWWSARGSASMDRGDEAATGTGARATRHAARRAAAG
jgi:hypothetical protein